MSNAFDVTVQALRKEGMNSDEILEVLSELFQKSASLNKEVSVEENTDAKIKGILKNVGIPCNLEGYACWIEAIKIYKEKGRCSITKIIYPQVAEKCGITPARAERAMRFALEYVEERCPEDILFSFFGNTISSKKGAPTNSEFLAIIAEQI